MRTATPTAKRSVLDDLGNEITGIALPVSICMAITVILVKILNPEGESNSTSIIIASVAYDESGNPDDSSSAKFSGALLNALIFVAIVVGMTVLLFTLFYYGCYKIIYGYMGFAMFDIFFLITGILLLQLLEVVGMLGVLFMPIPLFLKQSYMVWTGVIVAYVFTWIPEWTSWVLLALMALYDIAAVLMPGGPLKMLVELAITRQQQLPALVYEARPQGRYQGPDHWVRRAAADRVEDEETGRAAPESAASRTPLNAVHQSDAPGQLQAANGAGPRPLGEGLVSSGMGSHNSPPLATAAELSIHKQLRLPLSSSEASCMHGSIVEPSGLPSGSGARPAQGPVAEGNEPDEKSYTSNQSEGGSRPGMTNRQNNNNVSDTSNNATTASGTSYSAADLVRHVGSNSIRLQTLSGVRAPTQWHQSHSNLPLNKSPPSLHSTPLLADSAADLVRRAGSNSVAPGPPQSTRELDNGSPRHLSSANPRSSGGFLSEPIQEPIPERDDQGGPNNRTGTNGVAATQETYDDFDMPDGIKLGLGDFIFYSLLVGKAAMYDMMTVFAAYLGIIAGLGLTLLCLALFERALPALPFSIALGIMFYFLTRLVLEPLLVPMATNYVIYRVPAPIVFEKQEQQKMLKGASNAMNKTDSVNMEGVKEAGTPEKHYRARAADDNKEIHILDDNRYFAPCNRNTPSAVPSLACFIFGTYVVAFVSLIK
eukprot:gene13550-19420_t